ncbi:hypothetical protein [Priestia megaterium]|uniref:hypothetical protein n=1 Tax=Priestia megaterium TaxID=1404 RepID=UPI000BFBBA2F|nr:hypothetical protein [Priestia megaterium]MBW0934213.1 hypothetical protein [Priestia megaterium]PGX80587.1 hypothetical protein COE31_04525 [Priestia megaterium]
MPRIKFYIARYLEELIRFKWIAIGVSIYFYARMLKKQIVEGSFQEHMSINVWDISLNIQNDSYIILYFVIPIILLISTTSILEDFNYQTLIRLGTIKKWILRSLFKFWKKSSILILIWVFMSLYMTIKLPVSWNWSPFSKSNGVYNDLFEISAVFDSPLWAFVLEIALLILTFSILHIALSLIYATTKKKSLLLVFCVTFFIWSIAGFKLLPNKFSFFAPTTYFSITQYFHAFDSPIMGVGILLGAITFCYIYLLLIDRNIKQHILSTRPYLPFLLYLFLCVIGIISTSFSLTSHKNTILDTWVISFRGVSSNFFTYSSFFYYMIVFFGLIYLFSMEMNKEIDRMGYYKIIRFRNLEKWFWSWFKKILIKTMLVLILLTTLSFIIGAIMGMKCNFYVTDFESSVLLIFYQFFINGFLQVVLYILLIFIFSWTRREPVQVLVLISSFMILMLPGVNPLGIIPVGLNSLIYTENFSPFHITLILLIANLIMYFTIKYIFTKNLKI